MQLHLESYVKNSEHFRSLIKILHNNVSLEVILLYPNAPVDEAVEQIAMNEALPAYVIELADYCF